MRLCLLLAVGLVPACLGVGAVRPDTRAPGAARTPESGPALLLAARALAEGRPEDTLSQLAAARRAGPRPPTWWLLSAMAQLDLGRPAPAAADLEQLLSLTPEDAGSWALLARARADLDDWERAERALRRALALAPAEARHHASLGLVLLRAEQFAAAERSFARALELEPDLPTALHGSARLAGLRGQPDDAVAHLQHALDERPDDPVLLVELGHARREQGQPCAAFEAFGSALAAGPADPWLDANMGVAALECGDAKTAREHLTGALRRLAESRLEAPDIERWLGRAELALGNARAAERAFEAAWETDPGLPGLAEEYGLLLVDMGLATRALSPLRRGFLDEALGPEALLALCLTEEQRGDPARAQAVASELGRRRRGGLMERLAVARLHLSSEQPEWNDASDAARLLAPLVQGPLDEHAPSWLLLAEARRRQGDVERSLAALDAALALLAEDDPDAQRARAARRSLLAGRTPGR